MLAVNTRRQLLQLRRLDRGLYTWAVTAIRQHPYQAGTITASALKTILARWAPAPARPTTPCKGWVKDPTYFHCCPNPATTRITIQAGIEVFTTDRCQACRGKLAAKVAAGSIFEILHEEAL